MKIKYIQPSFKIQHDHNLGGKWFNTRKCFVSKKINLFYVNKLNKWIR